MFYEVLQKYIRINHLNLFYFLHHLQSKTYQNRTVGLIENGSWAPCAAKTMRGIVDTLKNVTVVEPVVTIRSVMKETDQQAMEALADAIAHA